MGAASSTPGSVSYSVNFTDSTNYTTTAQPYYNLGYSNFYQAQQQVASYQCENVCTSNIPYSPEGAFDDHGVFGVSYAHSSLLSFDLSSFSFGCNLRAYSNSDANKNIIYGIGNCTLNFYGYSSGAEFGLPPAASQAYDYRPTIYKGRQTGIPYGNPETVTLGDGFKGLKYVSLNATADAGEREYLASYNYTLVGVQVIVTKSQYTTHNMTS